MNELVNYIQQSRIDNSSINSIESLKGEHELLKHAGFIEKAKKIYLKMKLSEIQNKLGNPVIVKGVSSHSRYFTAPSGSGPIRRVRLPYLLLRRGRKRGFFRTTTTDLYLLEIDAGSYTGNVPKQILESVAKARTLELVPKVWITSKEDEVYDTVHRIAELASLDPVVVGYVSDPWHSHKSYFADFAVVLGIWGIDIKDFVEVYPSNPPMS